MYAHRVDILHVTDGDTVARAVPHNLVLDLLPARDAALHQHLPHPGQPQAVLQYFLQLHLVVGDAAAGTAQRIGGAQHHRIADGIGKINAVLYRLHHQGGGAGLPDALHQILELLPPLRVTDRGGGGAQQLYPLGCQKTGFLQLHAQVQAGLSPQSGQDAVGLFLLDDLLQHLYGQRLDIDLVGDVPVRHDRGGIGIDQYDLHPLLLQGTAGLGARIVKLRRLTDDDRAGTDHHNAFYIGILRHTLILLWEIL